MAEMCRAVYDRIRAEDLMPEHVYCTYIEEHPSRHSWETLRLVDAAERSELELVERDLPDDVRRLVTALNKGALDKYVEVILRAGHDRKRSRRGVPGFGRAS